MNPVMNDVPGAFVRVPIRPRSVKIDRKAIVLPSGGHFQGIQRIGGSRNEQLVVTSSSNTIAYCVICDLSPDGATGRARPPLTLGELPLKHAGGCQLAGNIMAVGVEDDKARNRSNIDFWDLAAKPKPALLTALTIERSGPEKVTSAGAVGITTYGRGALLAVGTWDCDTIDFYTTPTVPFSKFTFTKTWTKAGADKRSWIDQTFGAYQNVNLVTQRDGKAFLIGFHRSGDTDWMDLFSLNLQAPPSNVLRKIDKKHMYCTDGCSFRDGAGIYVRSPAVFDVYAVKGTSGDHATGEIINVNRFRSG
jgi:hypothetical protein